MELVTRQSERSGRQQRLLQVLICVHSAVELSGWCDLQIYLLTYLLTAKMQTNVTISWLVTVSASIGVDLTGIPGGGTHGGTYYKSPAVEAKKHIFLHWMQVIWCLKFCNMTKSGGTIPPAPNYTCPPPCDLCPRVSGEEDKWTVHLQWLQSVQWLTAEIRCVPRPL